MSRSTSFHRAHYGTRVRSLPRAEQNRKTNLVAWNTRSVSMADSGAAQARDHACVVAIKAMGCGTGSPVAARVHRRVAVEVQPRLLLHGRTPRSATFWSADDGLTDRLPPLGGGRPAHGVHTPTSARTADYPRYSCRLPRRLCALRTRPGASVQAQFVDRRPALALLDVGVALRGGDALVAKVLLDRPDVREVDELRRAGVPERVGRHPDGQLRPLRVPPNELFDRPDREARAPLRQEQGVLAVGPDRDPPGRRGTAPGPPPPRR